MTYSGWYQQSILLVRISNTSQGVGQVWHRAVHCKSNEDDLFAAKFATPQIGGIAPSWFPSPIGLWYEYRRNSAIADKLRALFWKVVEVLQDFLSENVDKKFTTEYRLQCSISCTM